MVQQLYFRITLQGSLKCNSSSEWPISLLLNSLMKECQVCRPGPLALQRQNYRNLSILPLGDTTAYKGFDSMWILHPKDGPSPCITPSSR